MKKKEANQPTQAQRDTQTTRERRRKRTTHGTQQGSEKSGSDTKRGTARTKDNNNNKKRERENGANINGHSTAHDALTPHCEREQQAKNRRNRRAAPHQPHGHKNEGSTCHTHTPVENSTMDVDVLSSDHVHPEWAGSDFLSFLCQDY